MSFSPGRQRFQPAVPARCAPAKQCRSTQCPALTASTSESWQALAKNKRQTRPGHSLLNPTTSRTPKPPAKKLAAKIGFGG
eukprot:3891997-Amphidinium_carterae.2